jgi:hypothetical protein
VKVVADTMLWVSYCTAKSGYRHRLIEAAHSKRVRFFTSDYILGELANTLTVDFEYSPRLVKSAVQMVRRLAKCVFLRTPRRGWVVHDPDDDPIVHTALLAKVDYLVTGDRALLAISQVEDVRIVSPGAFAELIGFNTGNGPRH